MSKEFSRRAFLSRSSQATVAAAGAMAVPLSLAYGLIGFLAGLHVEREPYRWTLPPVSVALFALLLSGETWISRLVEGSEPTLSWKLTSLCWTGLFSLLFVGIPPLKQR